MAKTSHLIACHDCDLLYRVPAMPTDSRLICRRCGALLLRARPGMISRTLPLAASGLVLFGLANCFPFMSIKTGGLQQDTIFISGIFQLFQQDMLILGAIVVVTTLLAPLLQLLGLSYILTLLMCGKKVPGGRQVLKSVLALQPWSMLEIYLVGVLVALVKLLKMATIIPGVALYSFTALILVQMMISLTFDHHQLWERVTAR